VAATSADNHVATLFAVQHVPSFPQLQDWNKVHAERDYRPCCGYRLNSFTLTQYFGLGSRDGMGYSGEQLLKRDNSEKYETGSGAYGSIRRDSAGDL